MLKTHRFTFGVVPVCLIVLGACGLNGPATGPNEQEPIAIDLGSADRANVELDMGAGEMNLHSGTQKLLEGSFEYNVAAWKPVVKSSIIGSHATITIQQPEQRNIGGNTHYRWDLGLSDKALLDLALNCGAGQAHLDLGNLQLRDVKVKMGAGQIDLDLRGHPSRDYDVDISGGVGQATVRLPQGVGIRADAKGGLGSITVTGLEKRGDHWENNLYDNSKVNVHLKVQGGIGEIRIIA